MRRFLYAAVAAIAITATISFAPSPAAAGPPVGYDNTSEVCAKSQQIVQERLAQFTAQIDQARASLNKNDKSAAKKQVEAAGSTLKSLAGQLRTEASMADAENVRTVLNSLANEFEQQGKALNNVGALQTVDVQRIQALADQLTAVCQGPSASPGATSPASPGTASPSTSTPATPETTTPETVEPTTPGTELESPSESAPASPTR